MFNSTFEKQFNVTNATVQVPTQQVSADPFMSNGGCYTFIECHGQLATVISLPQCKLISLYLLFEKT